MSDWWFPVMLALGSGMLAFVGSVIYLHINGKK